MKPPYLISRSSDAFLPPVVGTASRLSKSRVFFLDYGGTLVKDTPTTAQAGVNGKVDYDRSQRSKVSGGCTLSMCARRSEVKCCVVSKVQGARSESVQIYAYAVFF